MLDVLKGEYIETIHFKIRKWSWISRFGGKNMNKYFSLLIKGLIIAIILFRLGMSNLTIYEYIIFFLLIVDFLGNEKIKKKGERVEKWVCLKCNWVKLICNIDFIIIFWLKGIGELSKRECLYCLK